jgi:chromosome segregation ATPase
MSECSVCERHGSCTRCIAALRTDLAAADEHVRSLVGEVAALRAKLDAYEAADGKLETALVKAARENDALRAERDRYRGALERIAKDGESAGGHWSWLVAQSALAKYDRLTGGNDE